MRLLRGFINLASFHCPSVVSIGNFDGVHLGHRAVIKTLAEHGRRLDLPTVIVLFEPQPREYFLGASAPCRLTPFREKIKLLSVLPVDYVLVLRFNQGLADIEAEDFIQRILIGGLRAKHLVVGDDFRFGKNRIGDLEMLRAAGKTNGFEVAKTDSYQVEGQRVSSTSIRSALQAGEFTSAEKLLGQPYSVCGRIVHGDKKGRLLGFPTANILMQRKNTPIKGVFAVTITGIGKHAFFGVANMGTRPTVTNDETVLLETHIFDFDQEIYGRRIEVVFHEKIRDELRFDSLERLEAQIAVDAATARQLFML